ncbi:MAG: RHS repeat-associated core domain-containing protein [Chloroflexota bacterium]
MLTDSTGASTYTAHYDPYGAPIDMSGTSSTSFGYTGEQTDSTGLQYLRARYYDPSIGIFIAKDPVWGFSGMSQSMNGYSYVHGNPINLTDPSGLCSQFAINGFDRRCHALARDLTTRYGNGDPEVQAHLMTLPLWQLERINAIASTNKHLVNIEILPRLFHDNPNVASQAVTEYFNTCSSDSQMVGVAGVQRMPYGSSGAGTSGGGGGSGGGGTIIILAGGAIVLVIGAYTVHGWVERNFVEQSESTVVYSDSGDSGDADSPESNTDDAADGFDEQRTDHIFRDADGHFSKDTPANRKKLLDVASNPDNYLGDDQFGNDWYAENQPDGEQIWAKVRNRKIINAGINDTPKSYNPQTGLADPPNR